MAWLRDRFVAPAPVNFDATRQDALVRLTAQEQRLAEVQRRARAKLGAIDAQIDASRR